MQPNENYPLFFKNEDIEERAVALVARTAEFEFHFTIKGSEQVHKVATWDDVKSRIGGTFKPINEEEYKKLLKDFGFSEKAESEEGGAISDEVAEITPEEGLETAEGEEEEVTPETEESEEGSEATGQLNSPEPPKPEGEEDSNTGDDEEGQTEQV